MDVTRFKPAATTFMHLKSPVDEEPLYDGIGEQKAPVGITFHSPGSEAYENAVSRRTNRALVRTKKKAELTADLLRTDTVSFLTDITVSFDNLTYPPAEGATGETLFKVLYADREVSWIVDQANAHLGDWANFTKASPTS